MSTAKDLEKVINGKFKLLAFMSEDTGHIMVKKDIKVMGRQADALEKTIDKIHELKLQLQAVKIENDGDPTEVRKWTEELEVKLSKHEDEVKALKKEVTGIITKEEEIIEEEKRKRLFDQEIKLQEAKLKHQFELEKQNKAENAVKSTSNATSLGRAKLPKLVITPFQGTHIDWMRFWNQFETEIDKAEVSAITKFSYLKELLVPNVRVYIDGLLFTTEGYERAKNILKTKYGKPSEVANAYMQSMSLPTITGSSASKIQDFYEKLISSVHALETMGKLKEINGYVRLTLDKLPAIRADCTSSSRSCSLKLE